MNLAKIRRRRVYEKVSKIILIVIALVLIYFILSGSLYRSCMHSTVFGILLSFAIILRHLIRPRKERLIKTLIFVVPVVLYWIILIMECIVQS